MIKFVSFTNINPTVEPLLNIKGFAKPNVEKETAVENPKVVIEEQPVILDYTPIKESTVDTNSLLSKDIEDIFRQAGLLTINGKQIKFGSRELRDQNASYGAKNSNHKKRDPQTGYAMARDISIAGGNLNDYAEFTVNIITNKGLMNIRKFRWHPIKLFPTPSMNFYEYSNENSTKRELVDFNMSRYCELELLKGSWNDIELMEHSHIVKEKLYEIFQNSFIINKILFDDVGYYIFKIYLEAKQLGELRCDKAQIGIKIFIYDKKDVVSNEVKKNNLIYDRKNELQMHIGDKLVFYLSKDK